MIQAISSGVISEVEQSYITYLSLCEDENNIYFVPRSNGGTVYLVKFNKSNFSYSVGIIGTDENVNHPLISYDDNHLLVSAVEYGNSKLILHVVNKSDLTVVRSIEMNLNLGGDYVSPSFIEKRSDGGITILIYSKNNSDYSVRNVYVYNFAPMDILNDELNLTESFKLGSAGSFNKLPNGKILYHPEIINATCNEDSFRFLLYASEDFHSLKYEGLSSASIPFNCNTCDFSKVNSYAGSWLVPMYANVSNNSKIYVAGYNLSKDAVYEIHDNNLNVISHISPCKGVFYYIGFDYVLLYADSNNKLNLYYTEGGNTVSISDTSVYDYMFIAYTYNKDYVYIFFKDESGSVEYIVLSSSDIESYKSIGSNMYPFWYKR